MLFILRGRFTHEGIRKMIEKPDDREEAIAALLRELGGRLISYYVTLGEDDWLIVAECPDEKSASIASLVATASGGLRDIRTTVAMTSQEASAVFQKVGMAAKAFRRPGPG